MRYWGLLAAKLVAVAGILYGAWTLLHAVWPEPEPFMRVQLDPFGTDLAYTFAILFMGLFGVALVCLAILDQRYRCRTCARRLRMPVSHGSWNHILLGPPRIDYICPYGHGTLRVPELHIASLEPPDWHAIDNIWRELEELEKAQK
jgi:hypothetical protein